MTEVLRQKLAKLMLGEEGVALVVTLALFMFLYVSCAGVYTVGRAVKDRIILQNAVDAAAYSAAVVQADYLSRIATINKAMAWNYAQLLTAQKQWIAVHFFGEIVKKSLTYNRNYKLQILDDEPISLSEREVNTYSSYDAYEKEINDYFGLLGRQRSALDGLTNQLATVAKTKACEVLMANLPYRISELCRDKINVNDVSVDMSAIDDEEDFLEISASDAPIKNHPWFDTYDGDELSRDVAGEGKLSLDWETSSDGTIWIPMRVDVYMDAINRSVPCYHRGVSPIKLKKDYFPSVYDSDNPNYYASAGAITVAVAKKNENPWLGLVEKLTGIHAAFDHADKNDWTFAIASAQAGYRNNLDDHPRAYSLDGGNFDYVKFAKVPLPGETDSDEYKNQYEGQDWDAVYLPVRKAFAGNFKTWLTSNTGDDTWEKLVPDGDRDYVSNLDEIRFEELNHEALPRMHNSGGVDSVLRWDNQGVHEFLDLMYH